MRRPFRLAALAPLALALLAGCPATPVSGVNKDLDKPKPTPTTRPG